MWRVVYQREALKTLRRLDRKTVAPILDKLSEPAQDPHALNNNNKPLSDRHSDRSERECYE